MIVHIYFKKQKLTVPLKYEVNNVFDLNTLFTDFSYPEEIFIPDKEMMYLLAEYIINEDINTNVKNAFVYFYDYVGNILKERYKECYYPFNNSSTELTVEEQEYPIKGYLLDTEVFDELKDLINEYKKLKRKRGE